MVKFLLAIVITCVVLVIYDRATRSFLNSYKLVFIFGKKGSGKSTLLTKYMYKALKEGRPVYANFPVPGVRLIDNVRNTVGYYSFEPGAAVFLDECGTIYDNRLFKSFKPEERDFFKLQRHYRNTVYMSSQSFDIDLKLRELTDEMYLVRKFGRIFSVARRIDRHITITQPSPDAPSTLQDSLEFAPIFSKGAVQITFIPRWCGLFDSFAAPELPPAELPQLPDREWTPRTVIRDWCAARILQLQEWCAGVWDHIWERLPEPDPDTNDLQDMPDTGWTLRDFFHRD